ncbi:MAG TPA: AsmA family protein [Hyphomicrobium sp.]|nr:AsmA family protein [Hyphomicrobium sp.]
MNNALLYLGGILITVLAVLFAVPRFVDWNSYRGVFEEEATRILGREVRVGGAVNVRLLPAPYVSFERLRIADVGDDGGNSIIRVDSFTMWLSVPPLLRGVLEAHKVELRRPVVNLATNAEGTGNWRSLAVTPGTFPFAPKEVALQSVQIHDGAVIISGPARAELARFDAINGELNAEALEGPFKFKGQVSWGGAPRQVKIATAKLDPNGDLRFKAAVDVADSANSYMLDGRFSDIKEKPSLDCELTAKLAFAPGMKPVSAADEVFGLDAAPAQPAATPPANPAASPEAPGAAVSPSTPPQNAPAPAANGKGLDLKAKVKGTTQGVELQDITVSLEAGTTPQLITGQAKFGWADKMRLDVDLASRWLDLDQLQHTASSRMPLEAGRSYFEALAAALPAEAETNARLEFDQITLGGEPISNVRLAASRSEGPLQLKGVRADLPGGVRLELDGILTPTEKVPRLDGSLFVSGKSLLRFLAWGLGNADVARERNDGPFSLDGKFALGTGTLALSDASFSFAGTPLEGDLKLDLGERKKVVMTIEGPRVDVAQIGPGLVGLNVLRGLLFGTEMPAEGTPAPSNAEAKLLDPAGADLSIDLKVAELVDGNRVLTDVDTTIRIDRGTLVIPRLRFATPEGLYVEAEGEAKNVPAHPEGTIRGLISAPSPQAARALVSLLDVDESQASDLDRITRLAPLRLAGTLTLAGTSAKTNGNTLALDGTVGGGRLTTSVRIDGDSRQWRTSPLDVQATLDSPDVAGLVATLFDANIKANAADPAKSGRVVIKAAGVPAQGMLSLADVTADGFTLGYRGQVSLPAANQTGLDGDLKISAPDSRVALALAGLTPPEGAAGIPLDGTIRVRREGTVLKLGSDAVALGASTVSGEVSLTSQESGRRTIAATLKADKASFATLLAPVLGTSKDTDALAAVTSPTPPAPQPARRPDRQPEGEQAADAPPLLIWPEQAFDLSLLERVDGKIDLAVGALTVEPGLTVGNARVVAELSPQGVKVASLEGNAVGGRLASQLELAKAPAGVALTGTFRIDISSKPQTPDASGTPPPGDAAHFGVTVTSRALSPAGIMAAMTGKGELTIGDATLNGNSPAAVSAVVRAALTGQGPSGGDKLAEAIRAALKQGEVKLGKIAVPVEISDGALKLEKVRIDMSEGRSTFATAVELATMKVDSEWQIEPKLEKGQAANPARAFLPPVTVVYTGKLSQFATLVPQVQAGALERELVVRKMELDVGQLERLRKEDQERARQDAERRKALEEDQAITPPAPSPAPAPPTVTQEPLPPAKGMSNGAPDNGGTDTWDTVNEVAPSDGVPPGARSEAITPPPPQAAAPSPASERPAPRRRPRPANEEWRPFQAPY